jgi:hypothetical protein
MAMWLARLTRSFRFGLQPNDPAGLAAAGTSLLMVCALAARLPAWRAAHRPHDRVSLSSDLPDYRSHRPANVRSGRTLRKQEVGPVRGPQFPISRWGIRKEPILPSSPFRPSPAGRPDPHRGGAATACRYRSSGGRAVTIPELPNKTADPWGVVSFPLCGINSGSCVPIWRY